ncbi:hypothetical protein SAMN04487902_11138 [Prevotella sp. ne3005]|nr:hypothetical protein SAMN04487902_11138 [Prevotella sp. ne3005]
MMAELFLLVMMVVSLGEMLRGYVNVSNNKR